MIISVTGFIGSGKDTVANYLTSFHGFKKESFAGSLKDAVSYIFGWDRTLLEGNTTYSREWREQVDPWWSERLGIPELTPRWVLQHWGTEVARNHFHDDIWIASLENKITQSKDDIVITDTRFPNELAAIKRAGGTTIRITRGPKPIWYDDAVAVNRGDAHIGWILAKSRLWDAKIHPSEYMSVGLHYDYEIENDGTIDDLHTKIKTIMAC
jgi:hypothetical protein